MIITKWLRRIALTLTFLSTCASAGLIEEIDIFNNGTNKGFSESSMALEWLDLSVTYGQSISDVNQRLSSDLLGYRWAKESEVLSLWHSVFFQYMGQDSLPVLTGDAIPFVTGVWFGANTLSAGSNSNLFFESLSILGAPAIRTTTNEIGFTYSNQRVIGYFESKFNNYGYALASLNDKALYRGCDPAPCFEESRRDSASVWYFDGASPLYKNTPNNTSFSDASSFLVKDVAQVPEPSTLAIFALGLIGLSSRRFKKQS